MSDVSLTAWSFYLQPGLREDVEIRYLESLDGRRELVFFDGTELDAEVTAFLSQPGQRYKVTITRAAEENDDADAD